MTALRSILFGLLMAMAIPSPATAEDDLLRFFAGCAGRFSAELENRWLMSLPSQRAEQDRRAAIQILEAIQPAEAGAQVLSWRIDAKYAQAALLRRAYFNDDPADMATAAVMSRQHLDQCRGVLLPGGSGA